MTIQHISFKAIRTDPKWKYQFDEEDPILNKSLKLTGVLSPLVLLHDKDEYAILDGFKRHRFLKDNAAVKVPAFLYSNQQAKEGLLHSLALNETRHPLTTIEKSNVVKLTRSFNGDEDFQNKVCDFLDIPFKRQFIQKYLTINAFAEKAKHYFHEYQFSLRQIDRVIPVSIESLLSWINLAEELHIKAQEFVQLVETIWDISIRENIAIDQLYHAFKVDELLRPQSTAQQKSANLKNFLHQKRYPMLNNIQEKMTHQFERVQKYGQLPMKLSWDKTLEQSGYWLNIHLEHQNSVDQLKTSFESPELRSDLKKLFKIIMNNPEDSNETT